MNHTRLSQYVLKRNRVALPHVPQPIPPSTRCRAPAPALLRRKAARSLHAWRCISSSSPRPVDTERVARPCAADPGGPAHGGPRLALDARAPSSGWTSDIEQLRQRLLRRRSTPLSAQLQDTRAAARPLETRGVHVLSAAPELRPREGRRRAASGKTRFSITTLATPRSSATATHLRLDDDYVRVLTLKEPPAQTFPHLFQALYEIPSNLILDERMAARRAGRGPPGDSRQAPPLSQRQGQSDQLRHRRHDGARRPAGRRQRRGAGQRSGRLPHGAHAPGPVLRPVHDDGRALRHAIRPPSSAAWRPARRRLPRTMPR